MSREQAATQIRERIGACDTVLLDAITAMKEVFGEAGTQIVDGRKVMTGVRLAYLHLSDGFTAGDRRAFDEQGINPKQYEKPKASNKGSLKGWLAEQEGAHIAEHTQQARAGAGRGPAKGRRARVG